MFGLKHTFQSVASELVDGLDRGVLTVDQEQRTANIRMEAEEFKISERKLQSLLPTIAGMVAGGAFVVAIVLLATLRESVIAQKLILGLIVVVEALCLVLAWAATRARDSTRGVLRGSRGMCEGRSESVAPGGPKL